MHTAFFLLSCSLPGAGRSDKQLTRKSGRKVFGDGLKGSVSKDYIMVALKPAWLSR